MLVFTQIHPQHVSNLIYEFLECSIMIFFNAPQSPHGAYPSSRIRGGIFSCFGNLQMYSIVVGPHNGETTFGLIQLCHFMPSQEDLSSSSEIQGYMGKDDILLFLY